MPDGVLLSTGEDSDGSHKFAVGRQRSVSVHVGAQDVRQYEGIAGIGLLS